MIRCMSAWRMQENMIVIRFGWTKPCNHLRGGSVESLHRNVHKAITMHQVILEIVYSSSLQQEE